MQIGFLKEPFEYEYVMVVDDTLWKIRSIKWSSKSGSTWLTYTYHQ